MNVLSALQKAHSQYRALTSEQRQVYRAWGANGTKTAAEWLALLTPLARMDQHADIFRSGWQVLLLGIFLVPIVIIAWQFNFTLGFAIAAALALPLVIYGVMWFQVGRQDLANDLRTFVIPFLKVLREDLPNNEGVTLELDLSPLLAPAHRVSRSTPRPSGIYFSCVDSVFVNQWFRGSAMLADKSRVKWSIEDKVKLKEKRKRSPRGKIRERSCSRGVRNLSLQVSFPVRRYGLLDLIPPGSGEMTLVEGPTRNTIRFSRRFPLFSMRNGVTTNEQRTDEAIEPLLDAIGAAYRHAIKPVEERRRTWTKTQPAG